jgi:hypothetical protein
MGLQEEEEEEEEAEGRPQIQRGPCSGGKLDTNLWQLIATWFSKQYS